MSTEPPRKRRAVRESWDVPASEMAKNTCNPIRRIVDEMKLTPNPEKEMIALSIGDPTVFGNLPCSDFVKDAVCRSCKADKFNGYAPSVGYEKARAAVAEYEQCRDHPISAKDVVLASGCSGAIDLAICVLANRGQNILIPRPGFSLYRTLAESLGVECRDYDLLPDRSWEIDLEHLESLLDDKTACIVVNSPSNPCGNVFSRQHIIDILDVASRHKIPILADEIYAHFVFPPQKYFSMSSLSEDVPILSCGGLTKRFLIPGWRMGWITIHDRNGVFEKGVRRGLLSLSQRILGPNTVIQGALEEILTETPQAFFDNTISAVQKNANIAYEALVKIPGLKPIMPQGAMYMMVAIDMKNFPHYKSDVDFTSDMVVEQSVFALPASCFQYPNYFRVVLTVPEDKLRIACERIAEFCADHYGITNGSSITQEPQQ